MVLAAFPWSQDYMTGARFPDLVGYFLLRSFVSIPGARVLGDIMNCCSERGMLLGEKLQHVAGDAIRVIIMRRSY
jgi:hypothetical protein